MQVGCATVTARALSNVLRVWVTLVGVGRTGGMQVRVLEIAACVDPICVCVWQHKMCRLHLCANSIRCVLLHVKWKRVCISPGA